MMMTTVYTMRAAMGNLKDDYDTLKTNITKLSNMTRYQQPDSNTKILLAFKNAVRAKMYREGQRRYGIRFVNTSC
jgi:hypothetical protein